MKLARALVFDLDGTVADTRLDIAAACNHALAAFGRETLSVDEVGKLVGNGAHSLVARAFRLAVGDPATRGPLDAFNAYYTLHAADHARWMPGAREALDACAHLPLALATNKPRAVTMPLLEALDLRRRFEVVVAGGDGPLKPDPAAILSALRPLGIAAGDAWVVGDGPQDIGAGRAAGAFTVGVLGGFAPEGALREAGPHRVIANLFGLPSLLDEGLSSTSTESAGRSIP